MFTKQYFCAFALFFQSHLRRSSHQKTAAPFGVAVLSLGNPDSLFISQLCAQLLCQALQNLIHCICNIGICQCLFRTAEGDGICHRFIACFNLRPLIYVKELCLYSWTPRLRALLSASQTGSLVNGSWKTNVCFAAACFSLHSLHYILYGTYISTVLFGKLRQFFLFFALFSLNLLCYTWFSTKRFQKTYNFLI